MNISQLPENPICEHPIAMGVRKAAEFADVSERTIWALIRKGNLPSLRIGTRVLILYADLQIYLQERVDRSGKVVRPDISQLTTSRNTHKVGA